MKYLFRSTVPPARSMLVIESGSQPVFRRALEGIRRSFPEARLHLLTCWPDAPPGTFASRHMADEYPSNASKVALLRSFRRNPPDMMAVLCSKEPVMYTWKLAALLMIPAKTLIINENGDFFWLDWNNRRALGSFMQSRWSLVRAGVLIAAVRALVFPLTILYLLANALWLYGRRWRRLLLWKIRGRSGPQGLAP